MNILLVLATFFAFVVLVISWRSRDSLMFPALAFVVLLFFSWRETWDSTRLADQQKAAERAAEKVRRETPRVIREADGCKVYKFEAEGRDRFFTRCPDGGTTTTWQHNESCGKNCTKTVEESVETRP